MSDTTSFPLHELARRVQQAAQTLPFVRPVGEVTATSQSAISVSGLSRWLRIGGLVEIHGGDGPQIAEVIRLDPAVALCKPYDHRASTHLGAAVTPRGDISAAPHESWRGRIIDALGRPADGGGPLQQGLRQASARGVPPQAMRRQLVQAGVATGVRVVDAFTPICHGQRLGLFAGSGVGKSTLLSMMARATGFDAVVVSLVGERGREVREFVELTLGPAAANAVTVVATGDESPMMRKLAPEFATAIAEEWRAEGQNVLLIMDSVTRYAHACREVALAAGEPPVARGYPPSVFSQLPLLLERAGPGQAGEGTITGIYAVLVDGDDHNEPVADAIRGTLDGHVVLDRSIAEQGRYPAVDLLRSLSRLAQRVWTTEQASAITELKRLVARYEDTRDLRAMGGYTAGAEPDLDRALVVAPKLYAVLRQSAADQPSADPFREIAAALSGGN